MKALKVLADITRNQLYKQKLLVILLTCSSTNLIAQQTYYWRGVAGGLWSTTTNWSPNGTPGSNDDIIFDSGGNTNSTMGASYSVRSITIKSTYTKTITMGANNLTLTPGPLVTAGTSTLAGGNATPISVTTGKLIIDNGSSIIFNQSFSGTISLGPTSDAGTVTFGPSNSGGQVTLGSSGGSISGTTKNLVINQAYLKSNVTITKTGSGTDWGVGGATVDGTFTLINSGGGKIILDSLADTSYNNNVDLQAANSGSLISICTGNSSASGYFGGSTLSVSSSSSATGISIGRSAKVLIGTTATLQIGSGGFTAGRLLLSQFAYTAASSLNITFPGTGAAPIVDLRNNTEFDVAVTLLKAPSILLNGCLFNTGSVVLEKTGSSNDVGAGGNTFFVATSITNSGSGDLITGDSNFDTFNSGAVNLDIFNTGTGTIRFADRYAGANSIFNMKIRLNSTSGNGIWFGHSGGTSKLQNTIAIGASGFTAGILQLSGFTDNNGQTYSLTTTGTSGIRLGGTAAAGSGSATASVLQGAGSNIVFTAPLLYLDGCTFNSNNNTSTTLTQNGSIAPTTNGLGSNVFLRTVTIINSGSSTLATNGGNTFNQTSGTTTITNSGDGIISLEDVSGTSTYYGNVAFTNTTTVATSKGKIYVANKGTTSFKGNITVSQANSASDYNTDITQSSGIYFGESGGLSYLEGNSKTITIGGSFISGVLSLKNFIQNQAAGFISNLSLTTFTLRSTLLLGSGTSFQSNATFAGSAPSLYLNGATFNGTTTTLTKTSNTLSPDNGTGGCTFASTTTTIKSSNGTLRMACTSGDTFNGSVTFQQTNPGIIQPGYSAMCTVTGNITFDSNYASTITFGANGGGAQFTGTTTQTISKSASASAAFGNLTMNSGAGGSLTLNTLVSVKGTGTFTKGIVSYAAVADSLRFAKGSSCAGGNDLSYVNGAVLKIGNDDFTFPVGNNNYCRSISISGVSAVTAIFSAQYFKTIGPSPTQVSTNLDHVSGCEYWNLTRLSSGGETAYVSLAWKAGNCSGTYVSTMADLRVAHWDGTTWSNSNGSTPDVVGVGSTTSLGTVTSSVPFSSFSPFTLATSANTNALPIQLNYFKAIDKPNSVDLIWQTLNEINSRTFSIERSSEGEKFESLFEVEAAGYSSMKTDYIHTDFTPLNGKSYYRLREIDFDGATQFSQVVAINRENKDNVLEVYPNPVRRGTLASLSIKGSVQVINSLGEVVLEQISTNQIDTSSLTPGIYIVASENSRKAKLIVQ